MSEDLVIFVGFAHDAREEATAIRALQSMLDSKLVNLNKVVQGSPRYQRVRIFNWEYDADLAVGGQDNAITPHLKSASVAVFVFKHRVGAVTWKELDDVRDRQVEDRIPVLTLFPANPPTREQLQDPTVVKLWLDVLQKKNELTSDWSQQHSRSVTPLEPYRDSDHLVSIFLAKLEGILPTLVSVDHKEEPQQVSHHKTPANNENRIERAFLDRPTPIADFDHKAVKEFRSNLRPEALADYPHELTDTEFLQRTGLIDNGNLTVCGALLFARNPTIAVPSAVTRAIVYEGIDKTAVRNRRSYSGPLLSQITQGREFVEASIKKREKPSGVSMKADTLYEYPMICVREVIANALCHREYDNEERMTHVRLFADRLEISSPGPWAGRTLPENEVIPLGDLSGQSIQRNMRLAQIISAVDVVEMEGSGIPTSITECRAIGAAEPIVEYSDGFITLTVFPRTNWGDAVEFYSCFISHAAHDEDFARRLYQDLTRRGVRCWLASQDIKLGANKSDAIDRSIRASDKVIVILSKASIHSNWVQGEVEFALRRERQEDRTTLIPIALDSSAFEGDVGWTSIFRQRQIGDFRDWKDHNSYVRSLDVLIRTLNAS